MTDKLNEPKWKSDLVKRIWQHARQLGYVDELPEGLGDLVANIRDRCDRCGMRRRKIHGGDGVDIDPYQCCWVKTETEDYCPHYCLDCHRLMQEARPHETTSV
jgi:hypothetical protein